MKSPGVCQVALDQYLARFVSPEEVARQCRAANEADASDDWEAFVALDLGGPDSVDLDYRAVLASSRA